MRALLALFVLLMANCSQPAPSGDAAGTTAFPHAVTSTTATTAPSGGDGGISIDEARSRGVDRTATAPGVEGGGQFAVSPGQVVETGFTLTNLGTEAATYSVAVVARGEVEVAHDVPESVMLQAQESRTYTVAIEVLVGFTWESPGEVMFHAVDADAPALEDEATVLLIPG